MSLVQEIEEYLRIQQLLASKPEWLKIIKKGLAIDARLSKFPTSYGWEAWQVNSDRWTLNAMARLELLIIVWQSRHTSYYRVNNPKQVKQVIKMLEKRNAENELPGLQ